MHEKEKGKRKKGNYKLTLRKASDIKMDAKTRFLDLVNKGVNKLNDIEKQLKEEYNISHGTVYNIKDAFIADNSIITWRDKGITYVDLPPFLPKPYRVALYGALLIVIVSMILDMIIPGEIWQNYAYLFGIYSQEKIIVIHPLLPLALASSTTFFIMAFIWRRAEKNKNYIK